MPKFSDLSDACRDTISGITAEVRLLRAHYLTQEKWKPFLDGFLRRGDKPQGWPCLAEMNIGAPQGDPFFRFQVAQGFNFKLS